ncbi:MAG: LysR family transcriptional regulator [Tagaea sp.]|nr:LysR family transcriptional regulator [Tagaea sp.]
MRFDPLDLDLALAVAETGSLAGAAKRVRLALASASGRLKAIEATLGVALFARHRRGLAPTAAGRAFLDHARALSHGHARLRADMAEFAAGARRTIKIAANTGAASEHLPSDLAPYLAEHPDIDIELAERWSPDIARAVAIGEAEIGIAADTAELAGVRVFPYRPDPLVALVPRGHELARRKAVTLARLAAFPMVALAEDAAQARVVETQAAKRGLRPRIRVRAGNFDALARFVAGGAGVAVMSRIAAERAVAALPVVWIPLAEDFARRRLVLCVRSIAGLSKPARALFERLRAAR